MPKRALAAGEPAFLEELRGALLDLKNVLELSEDESETGLSLVLVDDSPEGLRGLVKARLREDLRNAPAILWAKDVRNPNVPSAFDLHPLRIAPRPVRAEALKDSLA